MARVRDRSYPPSLYAPPVAPAITAVAPASVVAGAPATTFTATGAGIAAPVEVFYAGAGPSGQVAATVVSATSFRFTLPATTLATAGAPVVWNADIGPDVVTVDGPNIAVTATAGRATPAKKAANGK